MFDAKQMEWFNQLSAEDLAILGAGFTTLGDFFAFLALIRAKQEPAKDNNFVALVRTKQEPTKGKKSNDTIDLIRLLFDDKFYASSILKLIQLVTDP